MKKLLLIFSLACANVLLAQPTLNINGVQFLPGSYSFNSNSEPQGVPESGPNVTWDYSDLTNELLFNSTNVSYNGSGYPNASLRAYNDVGSTYFSQNSTGIFVEAIEINGQGLNIDFNYTNVETRLPLPFSYQSEVEDEFTCNFISGVSFDREGSSTFTGHGYGTLILPTGTVTDVLCIKHIQEYVDDSGMGFVAISLREAYAFYKNGFHYPLLNLDALDIGTVTYTNAWLNSEVLEVIESSSVAETFMMYPNPAGSVLNLKVFDNQSTVNIFDVNGRTVYTTQSSLLTETIDLSTFESGIYFVNVVSSSGATSTEKLVVNRN